MINFKFYLKYKKARLRQDIRAYNYLSRNKKLYLIHSILLDLIANPIEIDRREKRAGINFNSFNQYLVNRFFNKRLISSLLLGYMDQSKKIICILPSKWVKIIESNGIKVNKSLSKILFFSVSFFYLLYGLIIFLKTLADCFFATKTFYKGVDVHFNKLHPNNISNLEFDEDEKNIINWFKERYRKNIKFSLSTILSENKYPKHVRDKIISNDIPPLSVSESFQFLLAGLKLIILSVFDLIRGKFCFPIMLYELILLNKVKCHSKLSLAKEYLFNNTSFLFRPLWTYEAEKKGSKITLYFYSVNSEIPLMDNIKIPTHYGYKVMNWPNYLVWNKSQENFIKRCDKTQSSIEIVGPIYFSDSPQKKQIIQNKTVTIFDITPARISIISTFGFTSDYYNTFTCKNFLEQIYKVAKKNNFTILFKQKREVPNLHSDKGYNSYLKKFIQYKNVIKIDSDVNAYHLIKSTKGSISMPFTSTYEVAKHLNKPSIFFDPTKRINKRPLKNYKNGTDILYSMKDLDIWFKSLNKT